MTGAKLRMVLGAAGAGLSLAGLGVTTYLSVAYFAGYAPACGPAAGCERVTASAYAVFAGMPVAVLGVAMYALLLLGSLATLAFDDAPVSLYIAMASVAGAGVVFSAYLTAVSVFVLGAVCPWCVASAVLVAGLFVLNVAQAARAARASRARRAGTAGRAAKPS